MPTVNAVEPTRRNQDYIDMEREINSLRRQLDEAKSEAIEAKRQRNEDKKRIEELTKQLSEERWASRTKQTWLKRSMEYMTLLDAANNAVSKAMSTLRRNIGDGINS